MCVSENLVKDAADNGEQVGVVSGSIPLLLTNFLLTKKLKI